MKDSELLAVVCAAVQGLCAGPETSTRNPQSIAKKAITIALEVKNQLNQLTE